MSQLGKFAPVTIGIGTIVFSTVVDQKVADLVVVVLSVAVVLGLFYWLRSLSLKS